jgi:hypothetical protein
LGVKTILGAGLINLAGESKSAKSGDNPFYRDT